MRAAVLAITVLASIVPASAASTKSTYTDVSSCRSVDIQKDEFAHFCRGPAGLAAVLYYADGLAAATFGPAAKGKRDEVREGAGGEMEPLGIGATGKPFGDKIEWVSVGDGAPCATVVRMNLEAGSRLVVTKLGKTPERVAVVKGNKEAQSAAAKACGGGGQRADTEASSKEASLLTYEDVGLDHPIARKVWSYAYDDIKTMGMEPQVFNASFKRGSDEYIVSQMSRGPNCGMRACDTKLLKNGRIVELGLLCNAIDHHVLSADKRTITFCDQDVRIR